MKDHHALTEKMIATLRSKASAARSRVHKKTALDTRCDMQELHHHEKYKIGSAARFLSNFLKRQTLDLSAQQHFRPVQLTLREVRKAEYIYLRDKHEEMELDVQWLERQNRYIMTLGIEKMFNVYGYSYNGDVFVNNYIRGTFKVPEFQEYLRRFDVESVIYFPLFFPMVRVLKKYVDTDLRIIFDNPASANDALRDKIVAAVKSDMENSERYRALVPLAHHFSFERFWVAVLELYRDSLEDIIRRAPATTAPMVLYRGVESDYFLTKFMADHLDRMHIANSFVSTSSSVTVAAEYTNKDTHCCFMRIYVPKGTHMLLVAGVSRFNTESEFLLGHKTQFYITKTKVEKFCTDSYDFKMRITDLVVL